MAYTKQTWSDLPSTTTPVTATRLNHMEDGIEEASKPKKSISIGLGSNNETINIATSYALYKVPLSTLKATNDTNNDLFVIESNGIKIKKAGYYTITGTMMINNSNIGNMLIGALCRVRSGSTSSLEETYQVVGYSGYYTFGLTPLIQYFDANDIICLEISAVRTGDVIVGGNRFCCLTITEL